MTVVSSSFTYRISHIGKSHARWASILRTALLERMPGGRLSDPSSPCFFMSHGSTMMLGEDSKPAEFWQSVGKEAKRRGIKGIIWMGAHWEASGEGFEVGSSR